MNGVTPRCFLRLTECLGAAAFVAVADARLQYTVHLRLTPPYVPRKNAGASYNFCPDGAALLGLPDSGHARRHSYTGKKIVNKLLVTGKGGKGGLSVLYALQQLI